MEPQKEAIKSFWLAASWWKLVNQTDVSTIQLAAHDRIPRFTEATHLQIMGGEGADK